MIAFFVWVVLYTLFVFGLAVFATLEWLKRFRSIDLSLADKGRG